ncbi:MAG: hypothetical protein J5I98_31520 [Phaeodactylibacter sp.]|nr:hypothetical protein [Phaeodactylibacter sp.]
MLWLNTLGALLYAQEKTFYLEEWHATAGQQADAIDRLVSIADDAANLYVAGSQLNEYGKYDLLLTKYDDTGNEIWSTRFNVPDSTGNAIAGDIALGGSGYVVVTGTVYNGPANNYDALTAKFNSSGTAQWYATYGGAGSSYDGGAHIYIDASDNVYIAGGTASLSSLMDMLCVKYNSSGAQNWAQTVDGFGLYDVGSLLLPQESGELLLAGAVQKSTTAWAVGSIQLIGKNQTEEPEAATYTTVRYVKKNILLPPDEEAASTAISFIENRGQLTDSSGTAVEEVRFYNASAFPATYFHHGRISFVAAAIDTAAETPDTLHRVDLTFKNGKNDARVFGLSRRQAYHNYYLGHIPEGRARVGLYERVVQTDIYNKIDLVAYSNNAGVKYYFVVKPGGAPEDIQLKFDGQSCLAATEIGGVEVETSVGPFELPPPEAYQVSAEGERVEVEWEPEYEIEGDSIVHFGGIDEYDDEEHLVIEVGKPKTTFIDTDWVTYLGREPLSFCLLMAIRRHWMMMFSLLSLTKMEF